MTTGISTANMANVWMNWLRGTTPTAPAAVYVKLHVGDPGASGAANAAAGSTTRVVITWAAASAGTLTMNGTAPGWTNGGTTETLSHISFWDSSTAGNFLASAALSGSQLWSSGNTFTLTAQGWSITPVSA